MNFSQRSVDFLFENRLHDSREWFAEHKEEYREFVTEPMKELVLELAPAILKIDPQIEINPARISRIYRDMRLHPDSIFRDHIWYTFSRSHEQYHALPGFYFSIGAGGISYGCGYYCASAKSMQSLRRLILAGDDSFKRAFMAVEKQRTFSLYGDMYKRSKFPDQPEELRRWLDRKGIGLSFDTDDPEIMFSAKLAKKVAADFRKIAPFYDFCMKAEASAE
ncbi:MAG: DUF2461 domain-containing protein [Oscillospiraceae bacterium]|nr:DUF2461 domain-containing protein [Oscillospiraceae bacterium]